MDTEKLIKDLIEEANKLAFKDKTGLDKFRRKASMILDNIAEGRGGYSAQLLNIHLFPPYQLNSYEEHREYWERGKKKIQNLLETILEEIELFGDRKAKMPGLSEEVFIAHGHDEEMKEAVARTIERIGLKPIILHEQPNMGVRAVMEKLEEHSAVSHAIILVSPDDYGCTKEEWPAKAYLRARQNVIFELGFFIGKLGKEGVHAIYRENDKFEFPTDIRGVLYTPFDKAGSWRNRLVRELQARGYKVSADDLP